MKVNVSKYHPILVIGLFLFVLSCSYQQAESSKRNQSVQQESVSRPLRVGVSTNAPPLIFKSENKTMGIEADLAREFGQFLGKPVRFVELPWKNQIPALLENRTDIIMSGMSITDLRRVRIAFSPAYMLSGQMALVREADLNKYPDGYFDISKDDKFIRIGVVSGTTGEAFVRQYQTETKKIFTFTKSVAAVDDLLHGIIDIFIHDAPVVYMMASKFESKGVIPLLKLMTNEQMAWGINKNNTELLELSSEFLEQIKNNGKLDQIINYWIPKPN